ncbi:MAG: arginine--tRNA ligase, partial [Deltaproteobacteria bacterium]|nr:arginine--tRNA ligase [Deltaproteobacteria bacterium]
MKNRIISIIETALGRISANGQMGDIAVPAIELETTRDPVHGDYATNIAMILSSRLKTNPRQVAKMICDQLHEDEEIIAKVEIAGPGFINFFIRDEVWQAALEKVDREGVHYGYSDIGKGQRVQVEFVSANPTGPLHIGHARGAVVGDVLANILQATGYQVSREYYINDAGNQMFNLGRSVLY